MKVKINCHGQITIPVIMRLCAGSQPGDEWDIELKGPGRFELRHLTQHFPWEFETKWESSKDDDNG